jgi:ABC-type branched-subunit amino acid transport system ATPase component
MLRIDALSKHFGGLVAVDGCSFEVAEGGITGLIGPNGSGKTTVFNLVTGFLSPDSGHVTFRGEDVTGMAPNRVYARGIGRTFQIARIFPRLTALENVLVPVRRSGLTALFTAGVSRHERDHGLEMLEFVGLGKLAGEPGGTLSFGQRKLLELAAVLMARPELVLLDEPAGGVNPVMVERLGEYIRELNRQGISFLVVEHNLGFVMGLCHRVVVLHQGRPIAEGDPATVRADPAVLDAYLGA